jgi:acyl transferase domain-containing protein
MDTWQGPMSGWQELVGSWVSLAAFALLVLAAVTANALADTHPALGRWRDAAARTVDRAADRAWAVAAPRAEAALRWTAEVTDSSLVAVRRVVDEQWSARRRPTAPEATADRTSPAPATS